MVIILLLTPGNALAGPLADRLQAFPHWQSKPAVSVAEGDLMYPEWIKGTWDVTSTLIEQIAPLAPSLVTPGFEKNQAYLNQPVQFQVRFVAGSGLNPGGWRGIPIGVTQNPGVVADRAFNGLKIAQAYLGTPAVESVKVDPGDPNRQITVLKGDRQLVSLVTGRGSEIPAPDQFIATEITQQIFRRQPQIYLNEVETTTHYQRLKDDPDKITANQITAIYLSPQDPDYFAAGGKAIALYRYQLELSPVATAKR
ncbi:DUF6816 family protein [Laspinema olomoucense]|uniref:DUF6816 domain-containing protein n=2 Tax=Laspinema TaxID=2584823 RepID=A0ABT2N431_9CYAN|nr:MULTISPECIES: hypothetical protein [unclassified Laspinema]MCT7972317.1 hypothetical protein [Laspinema sp. D3d]MCT7977440.1 hypothetical protein [Laspinema sp. D3b]MCT7986855.1 hypothetical protein [Laspinema sp. D3a]MCT7995277.1 hypothetical protein [Laspinema sp. D3c]